MAYDTSKGRNEGQIAYNPQGLSNFQNIFGRDCPICDNSGIIERSDGGEGIIEYRCLWCRETSESKYNKRLEASK